MAKKPTAKKTSKPSVRKSTVRKSTVRKPRATKPETKPKLRSRPASKTKRQRVDDAMEALEEVLTGIGAEKAERIRHRLRAILNSFR